MPRYKLRIPEPGTVLHGPAGVAVVGSKQDALLALGDGPVKATVGRCRVLYKADIEAEMIEEFADPGDTWVDHVCDWDGERALGDGEVLVWTPTPSEEQDHER